MKVIYLSAKIPWNHHTKRQNVWELVPSSRIPPSPCDADIHCSSMQLPSVIPKHYIKRKIQIHHKKDYLKKPLKNEMSNMDKELKYGN